jgi:hypothetical protein
MSAYIFFKGNSLTAPYEYFAEAKAVQLHKVIPGENAPLAQKGHEPVIMLDKQIHDQHFIELNNINGYRPEHVHSGLFGIPAIYYK